MFGLSARGLAIDTALPSGEEFPRFTEFWIEKPQPDRRSLVIYALLDSPRATGAYRMEIKPGRDSVLDVQSKVYLRENVEKLGIAPLTSMYQMCIRDRACPGRCGRRGRWPGLRRPGSTRGRSGSRCRRRSG